MFAAELSLVLAFALVLVLAWSQHRLARMKKALDLFAKASTSAVTRADEASKAAGVLVAEATLQKRRADEFFAIIQGVEGERDTWQRFYRQSSQHAGAAQAWLIR